MVCHLSFNAIMEAIEDGCDFSVCCRIQQDVFKAQPVPLEKHWQTCVAMSFCHPPGRSRKGSVILALVHILERNHSEETNHSTVAPEHPALGQIGRAEWVLVPPERKALVPKSLPAGFILEAGQKPGQFFSRRFATDDAGDIVFHLESFYAIIPAATASHVVRVLG